MRRVALGMLVLLVACGGEVRPTLPDGTLLIAHRGASGLAPEHTFAAYDRAVGIGADYLEQDLHLTSDGVIVILHDETLDRTARGAPESCSGWVREKTLAQLETCDFGSWFDARPPGAGPGAGAAFAGERIVTLEALLRRYGARVRYYIETKHPEHSPGLEEALLALLDEHRLLPPQAESGRVVIQSFSSESLEKIHALRPDLPLVRLIEEEELGPDPAADLARFSEFAIGIGPHHPEVDADLVAAAGRLGLAVHPYTVNEKSDMHRVLDLGVDGVFTDFPDRFVAVMRSRAD